MTNDERAAVAREVLTEWAEEVPKHCALWHDIRSRIDKYPAPETVTVEMGGKTVTLRRKGMTIQGSAEGEPLFYVSSEVSNAMFARIAADARELAKKDKRIAELENLCDQYKAQRNAAQDGEERLLRERDEARRALEAAQSAGNAPPSPQTPMNAALGHLAATGASEGPQRAGNAGGATVAPECRDMATATSQGAGHEAGATAAASEPLASESPVATSPSPAPIPLGAVVEVPGDSWGGYKRDGSWWFGLRTGAPLAREFHPTVAALYRATHADAATVERVAGVFAGAIVAGFRPDESARRVLRALGIQEVGK